MTNVLINKISVFERRTGLVLLCCVPLFVVVNLIQDFIRSGINGSAFYFAESFIFSSFWWLFVPLLFCQLILLKRYAGLRRLWFIVALILVPIAVHLILYPVLVWLLSGAFYYHTYAFRQTLGYTISELLYLLILFYTIPGFMFWVFQGADTATSVDAAAPKSFLSSLLVSEGQKKLMIPVAEVVYFSAKPPYVGVYQSQKHFLLTDTLKSLSASLDPGVFVRIHKSTIVNVSMVKAFTSRNNGDYDLTLNNDAVVRMSRNYVTSFKFAFNKLHRLAVK